jgi:Tfp pilus assembly protein PilO
LRAVRSLQFYLLRSWHSQPLAVVAVLASSLGLAVVLGAAWRAESERRQVRDEIAALRHARTQRPAPVPADSAATADLPVLPDFDSAAVVHTFTTVVTQAGLPLDEVNYALEDTREQPYLRYRISLSVKSGYPQLRKAVAALASEMPNVALDAVRCGRENPAMTALACELTFSAFFRKPHG